MSKVKLTKTLGGKTLRRLRSFLHGVREHDLSKAAFFVFTMALIGAIGVILFERHVNTGFTSLGKAVWWSIVTMTTVGYGDLVPTTVGGRIVGAIIMFSGVGFVSMFTAAVSSFLITKRMREGKGLQKIKVKNHILLCGWSPVGEDVLHFFSDAILEEERDIVLVNELSEDDAQTLLQKFKELRIKYVHGDFTEESVLRRANVQDAFAAVVIPDESSQTKSKSDERTILAVLSIKAIEPKVRVTAHILDAVNEPHLQRANADKIVVSDRHAGFLLTSHIQTPGVPEVLDSLLSGSAGMHLARRRIPMTFRGKTVADLCEYFKKEKGAILIGFIAEEAEVRLNDILSGDYSSIDEFIKRKFQEAGRRMPRKARIDVNLNPPSDYVITENDMAVVIEAIS